MQKEQLKRPYFPPEITAVEFRVERGLTVSMETYYGNGIKAVEQDELLMMFISSQQNSGARMGEQMGYYGSGSFIAPGSSPAPAPGNGGYFGTF